MSVALQIPADGATPARLIPIATEAVYANEWLPVADSLGTTWLQRFQTGAEVGYEDLAQVMSEFVQAHARFVTEGKPHLATRANAVVEALRDAAESAPPNMSLYIG